MDSNLNCAIAIAIAFLVIFASPIIIQVLAAIIDVVYDLVNRIFGR